MSRSWFNFSNLLLSMQSPFLFPFPSNPKEVLQSMRELAQLGEKEEDACFKEREERRTLQLILTEAAASNVLKRLSLPLPLSLTFSLPPFLADTVCLPFHCSPMYFTAMYYHFSLSRFPSLANLLPLPLSLTHHHLSLSLSNQKNQPQPTRPDLFPSHFSLILLSLSSLLSSFPCLILLSFSLHLSPPPLVSVNVTIDPLFHSSLFFSFLSFSPNFFPLLQTSSLPKTHPTIILFSISILITISLSLSSNPHSLVKLFLLSLPLSVILSHMIYICRSRTWIRINIYTRIS